MSIDAAHQHDEREALAATFLALGPQAPTILPGWDAPDLLEHLLVRERAPQHMIGRSLPGPAARPSQRAIERLRAKSWDEQVELLRRGPGPLNPVGRMDAFSGQGELLIHHEDLRRAQPDWEPRELPAEQVTSIWRTVGLMSRVMLRIAAEVTLVSPRGGLRRGSRGGDGSLRVHGDPMELLLWVSGRDEVARVRVHGDELGLAALAEGTRGG